MSKRYEQAIQFCNGESKQPLKATQTLQLKRKNSFLVLHHARQARGRAPRAGLGVDVGKLSQSRCWRCPNHYSFLGRCLQLPGKPPSPAPASGAPTNGGCAIAQSSSFKLAGPRIHLARGAAELRLV